MIKTRINSIQFLRFVAFLFIFGWHINSIFPKLDGQYASCGVTFFVILSGFMMCYNYLDKISNFNLKQCIYFLFSKIKKNYLLFILCSILPFIWSNFFNEILSFNTKYISDLLRYLLLLQVYFPSDWFIFNGVSWYLSLTIALYVSSFLIFKLLEKIKTNILLNFFWMISLFIILYYYVKIFHTFGNDGYFLYICPIPRIIEFSIGAILCNIYLLVRSKINFKFEKIVFTIFEVLSLIFTLYVIKISNRYVPFNWSYTNIFPSILCIFIFALSKGYLSCLFSLRPFVFLGNLSSNLFFTHQVLITFLLGHNFLKLNGTALAIYLIIIILILNILYDYLIKKIIIIKQSNKKIIRKNT